MAVVAVAAAACMRQLSGGARGGLGDLVDSAGDARHLQGQEAKTEAALRPRGAMADIQVGEFPLGDVHR